jgi:hypothetical protein
MKGIIYELIITTDEHGNFKYDHQSRSKTDIPGKNRVYEYQSTPGHGYLIVPLKKLADLGITREISGCSFLSRTTAHLEEDCDAGAFFKALHAAGERIFYQSTHTNRGSKNLPRYHPAWAENRLIEGCLVILNNGKQGTVKSIDRRYIRVTGEPGQVGLIPTRLWYEYLRTPRVESYCVVHPSLGAFTGFTKQAEKPGDQRDPIWTASGFDGPEIRSYETADKARQFALKHGVSTEVLDECEIVKIDHDPWLLGYADIGTVVRAGIQRWRIDTAAHSRRNGIIRATLKNKCRTLTYGAKVDDDRPVYEHKMYQPGNYIQVPFEIVKEAAENYSIGHLLESHPDGVFISAKHKFEYIRFIQFVLQGHYAETAEWKSDPLWTDGFVREESPANMGASAINF